MISKVTAVCAAAVCVCVSGFPLIVQAAPATLNSPEAAVYEQADEGSRTVGNLVEGSTFEYMGDVTAEDGNVWHQITTAGGTVGYIRGDREIETGEAEQSQEEEQTAAEQSPEVEQSQEEEQTAGEQSSHTEDNGGPAPVENVPEEGTEEPENAGTADGMEERPLNNQPKKYVLTDSAKIKERESLTKIDSGGGRMESKRTGADITLFFGAALIFFCSGTACFCYGRIKKLAKRDGYKGEPGCRKKQGAERPKKKKHSRKRKTRNEKSRGEIGNVRKAGRGDGK